MTGRLTTLREEISQPLPLAYHPLYPFYEGGSLTRRFRGHAGPEPVRVIRCLGPSVE
jgi:hypothetical protein